MKKPIALLLSTLLCAPVFASQSSITEAEGEACMGKDKSRNETESAARKQAKRMAAEFSGTYIESTTEIENFELKQDLVQAFVNAEVTILTVLEEAWVDETDCYTIRIKAEVVPVKEEIEQVAASAGFADDPTAPLSVVVRSDKESYTGGEAMKVYIRGNKPFFARVIYVDAEGTSIQILPNPYREDNYFPGGVWHSVPDGRDRFDLVVSPPFGEEQMIVYASSKPLGDIGLVASGAVYAVDEKPKQISAKTRGIKITETSASPPDAATGADYAPAPNARLAEFSEQTLTLTTRASN